MKNTIVALLAAACPIAVACSSQPPDDGATRSSSEGVTTDAPVRPEPERARAFVEARYTAADVRHSFRTRFGETIDCIDFFAQPGVKALAARGTPITEMPAPAKHFALDPASVAGRSAFDGSQDEDGNERQCSDTTVPQVRVTVADLERAGGLDAYLSHVKKVPYQPSHGKNPIGAPATSNPSYAWVQIQYSGTTSFVRDQAVISVWNPSVPSGGSHSLQQTWTTAGATQWAKNAPCAPNCVETVEVGSTVDPGLFASNNPTTPHLFIYSTADGYQNGCYDATLPANTSKSSICVPWVGTPGAQFTPGMTLAASSAATSPPTMKELYLEVSQCSFSGHCAAGWEVMVGTSVSGSGYQSEVGYYPAAGFTGSFKTAATGFAAGGEVDDVTADFNVDAGTDTFQRVPMGNGASPLVGFGKAAYVHDWVVYPTGWDADFTFGPVTSSNAAYGFSANTNGSVPLSPEYNAGWEKYFYLGAPAPQCVPKTCAAQGYNCGAAPDQCGGGLSCGTCATGDQCLANVCTACAPLTCFSAPNRECGAVSDACGQSINCGSCPAGKTCQSGACIGGGGTGGTFCTNCRKTGGICTVNGTRETCIHE